MDEAETPPFWLQTSTTFRRAGDRRRHRSSSVFLNSGVLVALLLGTATLFIFFIIPSILSLTSRIFKPDLVKKSWDSLNLVLVLFAMICGFLSKKKDENENAGEDHRRFSNVSQLQQTERSSSPISAPQKWYEYPDRTVVSSIGTGRLMKRNSSSYPDFRREPWFVGGEDQWRFFDDTQMSHYRVLTSDHHRPRRPQREYDQDDSEFKNIPVDTFETRPRAASHTAAAPRSPPPPPLSPAEAPLSRLSTVGQEAKGSSGSLAQEEEENSTKRDFDVGKFQQLPQSQPLPPPPPPPLPPSPQSVTPPPRKVRQKARRSFESLARKEKTEKSPNAEFDDWKFLTPPPPAPPPPSSLQSERKRGKSDRKRGGSSATKEFLTSLYHHGKKKKRQRQKSLDNFDTIVQDPLPCSPSGAPPPPPPPPPSVFHNLFSTKKAKTKTVHSVPPPPPPPPPPLTLTALALKTKAQKAESQSHPTPIKTHKYPLPVEENTNSGSESPLIPIPPPPPPPPFRVPDWKFAVHGDFVRLLSSHSSRSGSPDPDQAEASPTKAAGVATETGETMPGLFCPSPDVNTKADSFIARFRAGLRMEKMNSFKERQMSGLGPGPGPHPNPTHSPGVIASGPSSC